MADGPLEVHLTELRAQAEVVRGEPLRLRSASAELKRLAGSFRATADQVTAIQRRASTRMSGASARAVVDRVAGLRPDVHSISNDLDMGARHLEWVARRLTIAHTAVVRLMQSLVRAAAAAYARSGPAPAGRSVADRAVDALGRRFVQLAREIAQRLSVDLEDYGTAFPTPFASRPANDHDRFIRSVALGLTEFNASHPDAARHIGHYLGATGTSLTVDVDRILREVPEAQDLLRNSMWPTLQRIRPEITRALAEGRTRLPFATSPITVAGGQVPLVTSLIDKAASPSNWQFALGDFSLRAEGEVLVRKSAPDEAVVTVRYRAIVTDRYDFHDGVASFALPFLNDDDFNGLHEAGLAREYDVRGSSTSVGSFSVPLSQIGPPGRPNPVPAGTHGL
ncbi:MAG: hypothetical protein ACRCYQ_08560 [Nocardioides sp.]